jgi:hypothetical protein
MQQHSSYTTMEKASVCWIDCYTTFHFLATFHLKWYRRIHQHHDLSTYCGMCLAPFATVWKVGGICYHPWNILLQYVSLLTFINCMYIKQVLCNTVHYIYEVYKFIYIYIYICTCSGSHCTHCVHGLATGLEHWELDEYVGLSTTYLHILKLNLCKFGTK